MTSRPSIVALGAMALIVLAGPALAQSIDLSPVFQFGAGFCDHGAEAIKDTFRIFEAGVGRKLHEVFEDRRRCFANGGNKGLIGVGMGDALLDHRIEGGIGGLLQDVARKQSQRFAGNGVDCSAVLFRDRLPSVEVHDHGQRRVVKTALE